MSEIFKLRKYSSSLNNYFNIDNIFVAFRQLILNFLIQIIITGINILLSTKKLTNSWMVFGG